LEALPTYEFARHDGLGQRVRMAEQFGRVKTEHRQVKRPGSKSAIHHLYLGAVEVDGKPQKKVRIFGFPSADGAKLIPFATAEDAALELRRIRSEIIAGSSPGQAIKPYLPKFARNDLVESRVATYLEQFRQRVADGHRSPNTLRDLERWTREDGHWGWWFGRTITRLSNGDVKRWHAWLGSRGIGHKTQSNVSLAFRAFLRDWATDSTSANSPRPFVPDFPNIDAQRHVPKTLPLERVGALLQAIPWDRRGLFLAIAFESLRFSEAVAHTLEDWDGVEVHWHRGRQGKLIGSRVSHGKTRANVRREPWNPELKKWLEWRVEQTTSEQRLAGEATALFWNPGADNPAKAWSETAAKRVWAAALDQCGEQISMGEGLRHSVISALAEVLTERPLRAHTRHRDGRSLDQYTSGARPNFAALVAKLSSGFPVGDSGDS